MKKILGYLSILLLFVSVFTACKKMNDLTIADSQAHFVGANAKSYTMTAPNPPAMVVTVGTTDVSATDRVVTVNVTSPSGAVKGTHYNLSLTGNTITIPAGKATADISIQGIYAQYTSGRKDTLVFSISSPSIPPAGFLDTVKVVLRGPCFDGEVATDYAALAGAYNARENAWNSNGSVAYANYGPYTSNVSDFVLTSPTTATFKVSNVYEVAAYTGTFSLDWSLPGTPKVTCTSNKLGDGAAIGASLATYDIYAEPNANPTNAPEWGTFGFCNQTITVKFMLGARSKTTGALAGYLSAATGGGAATFSMVLTR